MQAGPTEQQLQSSTNVTFASRNETSNQAMRQYLNHILQPCMRTDNSARATKIATMISVTLLNYSPSNPLCPPNYHYVQNHCTVQEVYGFEIYEQLE